MYRRLLFPLFTVAVLIVAGLVTACASTTSAPSLLPVPTLSLAPTLAPQLTTAPTTTTEPVAPKPVMPALNDALPEACRVAGRQTYVNPFDGYCFAYPSRFELKMSLTGQPELYGPALEPSLDPLRAVLALEVEVAVRDANLDQIVDVYQKQFADLNVPPIVRTSITLGGESAEQLEVMPGRTGSRDIFALHNGTLYHFLFMPSIRDFPQAKADVEELYSSVMSSFNFTSTKPGPLPTS